MGKETPGQAERSCLLVAPGAPAEQALEQLGRRELTQAKGDPRADASSRPVCLAPPQRRTNPPGEQRPAPATLQSPLPTGSSATRATFRMQTLFQKKGRGLGGRGATTWSGLGAGHLEVLGTSPAAADRRQPPACPSCRPTARGVPSAPHCRDRKTEAP